jgi:hypothetical protein
MVTGTVTAVDAIIDRDITMPQIGAPGGTEAAADPALGRVGVRRR